MKHLIILLILCSPLISSQEPPLGWSNSELFFITTGLELNETVRYYAEPIGARWEADDTTPPSNYALTTDYGEGWYPDLGDTGKSNVSTSNPGPYYDNTWGFDFINTYTINDYTIAYGVYRISISESGKDAYFFVDYRDTRFRHYEVDSGSAIDVWFIYDGEADQFGYRRYLCEITIDPDYFIDITDGDYLPIWEIKEQSSSLSPATSDFEDYWENCLVMIDDGNDHPKLIWGPHPTTAVDEYRIFRKIGSSSWDDIADVDDEVFEYTDDDVTITPPGGQFGVQVYYYVKGVVWESPGELLTSATDTVDVNVRSKDIEKVADENFRTKEKTFYLSPNYPNPFNPNTTIDYHIINDGFVSLKVFDILGNEVAVLVNENMTAGSHSAQFNASSLASGIYLYKLSSGNYTATNKLIILE